MTARQAGEHEKRSEEIQTSLYQVDKLLFALFNDLELQESYKQNPAEVLKRYDLPDSELEALRDLDAGALSDPRLSF